MTGTDVVLASLPSENQGAENLGLASLAASLRIHGITVTILDPLLLGLSERDLVERILESGASLVGFQVYQDLAKSASRLVREVKTQWPELPVIIGGYFPTLATECSMNSIPADLAVHGEADLVIVEIAKEVLRTGIVPKNIPNTSWWQNGTLVSAPRTPPIADLDSLPFVARDYLPIQLKHRRAASIVSSRGCYGSCTFCSQRAFYRSSGWRSRSPENVVEEISYLKSNYCVEQFIFQDDNFIGPSPDGPERARRIAEILIRSGLRISFTFLCRANDVDYDLFKLLKEAGLEAVTLGLETFNSEMLRRFNKGVTPDTNRRALKILRDLDLRTQVSAILTDSYTSFDEMRSNYEELEKETQLCTVDILTSVIPWMGTAVYQEAIAEGLYSGPIESPSILFGDPQTALAIERLRKGSRVYKVASKLTRRIAHAIRMLAEDSETEVTPSNSRLMAQLADLSQRCDQARASMYRLLLNSRIGDDNSTTAFPFDEVMTDILAMARSLDVKIDDLLPGTDHGFCVGPSQGTELFAAERSSVVGKATN